MIRTFVLLFILPFFLLSCLKEKVDSPIPTYTQAPPSISIQADPLPVVGPAPTLRTTPLEELPSEQEGMKKVRLFQDASHSGIELSYPEIWGDAGYITNINKFYLTFGNLLFTRGHDGYISDSDIEYEGLKFSLGLTNFRRIIDYDKNYSPGGESVTYNIDYIDSLREKIANSDTSCENFPYLGGAGTCWDTKMVEAGTTKYFSYNHTFRYGDCGSVKKWIGLVGDTVLVATLPLDDFASNIEQDMATCVNVASLSPTYSGSIKFSDFSIDEKKVKAAEDTVIEFLSSLEINQLASPEDIQKERDALHNYKLELIRAGVSGQ